MRRRTMIEKNERATMEKKRTRQVTFKLRARTHILAVMRAKSEDLFFFLFLLVYISFAILTVQLVPRGFLGFR